MNKIPVYFMPGLGANATIFEKINLPKDTFEMYFLEWLPPEKDETLESYTKRLRTYIVHENPVLIGVSFGGIIVQELKKLLPVSKTIIISSVRSKEEFPIRMKFAKITSIYKLFPTKWANEIENAVLSVGSKRTKRRVAIYDRYMTVRDQKYLDWSLKIILNWENTVADTSVVHIHGDKDEVFPLRYLKDVIIVNGGTHAMILIKHKWLNDHLPDLILKKNE